MPARKNAATRTTIHFFIIVPPLTLSLMARDMSASMSSRQPPSSRRHGPSPPREGGPLVERDGNTLGNRLNLTLPSAAAIAGPPGLQPHGSALAPLRRPAGAAGCRPPRGFGPPAPPP